jgi:hypothetical protein
MSDVYFIRYFNMIGDARFAPPRRRDTVRRSLSGTLCVLAFATGNAPREWKDGRTEEEMRDFLSAPESANVWYTPEDI